MIFDCNLFWCQFEQHLMAATRQYAHANPCRKQEEVFQRLLCCQLATMGGTTMEEKGFKDLFPKCPSGQYLPDRLGGVDLALMPLGVTFDPNVAVGLELKVFSNNFVDKHEEYRNVKYFADGNFTQDENLTNTQGKFLQKGCLTFCKEGQLLQDYCRAARILARQEREFFILCGVMHYCEPKLTASILEGRIETLIERFRFHSLLYCFYDIKFMVYAQLTPKEKQTQYTIKVLPIPIPGFFAYYVAVKRN